MELLKDTIKRIEPVDSEAMEKARERQDDLTKPRGSLGKLEEISIKLAGIQGNAIPEIKKEINPATGEVLAYNPDLSTKKEIKENLFGVGAGVGVYRPVTEKINVILAFKLNVQLNSKYYNFLSSKGIYTSINLGFNFSI